MTGEQRRLHPAVRTFWRVRGIVGGLPFLLVAAVLAVVGIPGWIVAVAGVFSLGVMIGGWWWASARYARFRYHVTPDVLEIRDGVVVHIDTAVPLFRVQHIDVASGPLERLLDLASLVVHTAAPAADATLPGIASADAATLRDEILVASREAAVRYGLEDLDAV